MSLKIPICFEHEGITFTGQFVLVNGAASTSKFDLYISKMFWGTLRYSNYQGAGWVFTSNSGRFDDYGDFFADYVVAYTDGLTEPDVLSDPQ